MLVAEKPTQAIDYTIGEVERLLRELPYYYALYDDATRPSRQQEPRVFDRYVIEPSPTKFAPPDDEKTAGRVKLTNTERNRLEKRMAVYADITQAIETLPNGRERSELDQVIIWECGVYQRPYREVGERLYQLVGFEVSKNTVGRIWLRSLQDLSYVLGYRPPQDATDAL